MSLLRMVTKNSSILKVDVKKGPERVEKCLSVISRLQLSVTGAFVERVFHFSVR